jgi:hypothetical protein
MTTIYKPKKVSQLIPLAFPMDECLSDRNSRYRLQMCKEQWGWEPHAGGQEEVWMANKKIITVACGRKWGKTELGGYRVATWGLVNGGEQFIAAPTTEQASLIFEFAATLLENSQYKDNISVKRKPHPHIWIHKDGQKFGHIIARTTQQDGKNIRGPGAHVVMEDESAFIPSRVHKEVILPFLSQTGGQLVMYSTPCGKNHFYEAFEKGQSNNPNHFSLRRNTRSNPYIDEGWYQLMLGELSPDAKARELDAEFQDNLGLAFPSAALEWHDAEDLPGKFSVLLAEENPSGPEAGRRYIMGFDPARWEDFGAAVILDATDYPMKTVAWARYENHEWDTLASQVAQFAKRWAVNCMKMDSTHGSVGDPLQDMVQKAVTAYGLRCPVIGVQFSSKEKQHMVYNLAAKLHQRLLLIPYHNEGARLAVDELRAFQREYKDGSLLEHFSAPHGKHDDFVSALMLVLKDEYPMAMNIKPEEEDRTVAEQLYWDLIGRLSEKKERTPNCSYW